MTVVHHYEVKGKHRITIDTARRMSWAHLRLWSYANFGNSVRERVVLQLILQRLKGAKKLVAETTMPEGKDGKLPQNVDWETGIAYIEGNAPR